MRRTVLLLAVSLVVVLGPPALTALIAVRVYWGHWFGPPDADRTAEAIQQIDHYSDFSWDGKPTSGPAAMTESARWVNNDVGESPWGRLPAALVRRDLVPTSNEPVPSATLDAVRQLLIAEGYSVGEVRAHLAEGRSASGERVVLAAVFGKENSNDHYPYYEVAAVTGEDGQLQPLRVTHYYFDVAGLEGVHWFAAIAVAIPITVLWGLCVLFYMIGPPHRRTNSATGSGAGNGN